MKKHGRRLIIFSIALYALTFAVLVVRAFIMFEGKRLLLSFRTPWIIDQALISLVSLLIPLQITAVVLSYGLGAKREEAEFLTLHPFHRVIKPAMIFFIIMTAAFTFLSEVIVPGAHSRLQERLYTTSVARNLWEQSESAMAEGRHREAYDYLEEYLELDPENEDVIKKQNKLMDQIIEQRAGIRTEQDDPEEEEDRIHPGMSAEEYLVEAKRFFDRGDYFSAHYYANLAYASDPSRLDADQLAKKSWRMINELAPSTQDAEQFALHRQKKLGFEALIAGRALEAYYLFTRLAGEYPRDPDITTYLAQSREAARNISFFRDELERTNRFPGIRHLVFLNTREETRREIIFIDTFKPVREGYYLFDIEVLSFTDGGNILYHFTAPYGKIINNRLVTLCIDREEEESTFAATYLSGTRPEAERNSIPLSISPEMMRNFTAEKEFLIRSGLPLLWDLRKIYADFGMRKETIDIEITTRLMKPFAFLLFAFLALAFSWAMRPENERPGFFAYPLIPLIPAVSYFLLVLYYYAARLFNGFLLITLGFVPTLAAIVLVQGLFLAVVFIYLAGQSTE